MLTGELHFASLPSPSCFEVVWFQVTRSSHRLPECTRPMKVCKLLGGKMLSMLLFSSFAQSAQVGTMHAVKMCSCSPCFVMLVSKNTKTSCFSLFSTSEFQHFRFEWGRVNKCEDKAFILDLEKPPEPHLIASRFGKKMLKSK